MVEALVHVAHAIRLEHGVLLLPAAEQLWERSDQPFDPQPRHLNELPRHQHLAGTRKDRYC